MKGYLSLFIILFLLAANGCNEETQKTSSENQGFLFFGGEAQAVTSSTGKIQRAKQVITSMGGIKLDGSAGIQPFSNSFFSEGFITGIAADTKNRVLYLCHSNWPNYSIVRVSFDGTELEVLYNEADGVNNPTAVAFDDAAGIIYWANHGLEDPYSQIMSASTSGEISLVMDNFLGPIDGISIAANKLYFSRNYGVPNDPDNSETEMGIMVKDLSTVAEPTWIYKFSNEQPISVAMFTINAPIDKIYWTDASQSKIYVGNLNGSQIPVEIYSAPSASDADILLFGQFWPLAISLDTKTNTIFWSEIQPLGSIDNPRIMMMNLTQENPQVLVDNYFATNLYCARF